MVTDGNGTGTGAGNRKASGKDETARSQLITVLIVDDERTFGEALEVALGREKDLRIVHVATDGAQGVRAAGRHHPDVVLVDAAMPGMSGIELAKRASGISPFLQFIFISGQPREALQELHSLGSSHPLLEKPFTPDALVACVRATLDLRAHASQAED